MSSPRFVKNQGYVLVVNIFFAVRTSKFLHLRLSLIRALRRAKKKTKRVIHLKKFNAMKSKTHLLKNGVPHIGSNARTLPDKNSNRYRNRHIG